MKQEESLSIHLTSENSGICDEILNEIQNKHVKSVASAKFMEENSSNSAIICGTSDGYVQILYEKEEDGVKQKLIKAFKVSWHMNWNDDVISINLQMSLICILHLF